MAVRSAIRIWRASDDYLSFDFAVASVQYEPQGERIKDRAGNVHRIASGTERYPSWLNLSLPQGELMRLNNESAPETLNTIDWLEAALRQQLALTVFVAGESLATDGSAITRNLAYVCKLDELSGAGLCSLPGSVNLNGRNAPLAAGGADPDWLELRLHVSEDGRFAGFDELESYSPYSPAR